MVEKAQPYICLFPGCIRQFSRLSGLDRHMKTHFPSQANKLDCPKGGPDGSCHRYGDKGFITKDHLDMHLRRVHHVDLAYSAKRSMLDSNRSPSSFETAGKESSSSTHDTDGRKKTVAPFSGVPLNGDEINPQAGLEPADCNNSQTETPNRTEPGQTLRRSLRKCPRRLDTKA